MGRILPEGLKVIPFRALLLWGTSGSTGRRRAEYFWKKYNLFDFFLHYLNGNNKMNEDSFPRNHGKGREKKLGYQKKKEHRKKINHSWREHKAAGIQRKIGLWLDRTEEAKALQCLSIQEHSVKCQEKDLFNSSFSWAPKTVNFTELASSRNGNPLGREYLKYILFQKFLGLLVYRAIKKYECFRVRTKPFLPFFFLPIPAIKKNCLDQAIEPLPLVNYRNIFRANKLAGSSQPRDSKG